MNNNKLFIFHKLSSNGVVIDINDLIEKDLLGSLDELTNHGVCDLITHEAVRFTILENFNRHNPVTAEDYDVIWYLEQKVDFS